MTQQNATFRRGVRRQQISAAAVVGVSAAALVGAPTFVHAVVNTATVTVAASDGENALPNQMVKLTSPQVLQISDMLPGDVGGKPQIDADADPVQGRTGDDGKWRVEVPLGWLSREGQPLVGAEFDTLEIETMAYDPKTTRFTFGLNATLSDSWAMVDSGLRPWLADAVQIGGKTALTFELPGGGYTTGDLMNGLIDRYAYRPGSAYGVGGQPKSMGQFITGFSNYLTERGSSLSIGAEYNTSLGELRQYFNTINYDPLALANGDWSASLNYDWRGAGTPQRWSGWADSLIRSPDLSGYLGSVSPNVTIPAVGAGRLPNQLVDLYPSGTVGTPLNYASDFVNFATFGSSVASIGRDLCNKKLPARRLDGVAPEGALAAAALPAETVYWK